MSTLNTARKPEDATVANLHAAPPDKPKSKRPFVILGVMLLLTAGSLGGWHVVKSGEESTDDAQVEADIVPVAARIGGFVETLAVHDDQRVHKGDLLLQLDEADLRARLRQAEAEVATARAQVTNAEAQERIAAANEKGGTRTAEAQVSGSSTAVTGAGSQIAVAKAGLDRARADVDRAETEQRRAEQLAEAGAGSKERADTARSATAIARASLAQAKAMLAAAEEAKTNAEAHVEEARGRLEQSGSLQAQVEAAAAGVKLAQARLQVAEAAAEQSRLQLSYARVTAPQDGTVTRLQARAGQMLALGQPLAWIVPDKLYVVANFKETQVGAMRAGQAAHVRVDTYPDRLLEGKIESVAAGTGARFALLPPDNASGNFVKVVQRVPVRVIFERKPSVALRAGMSCDVEVEVGAH